MLIGLHPALNADVLHALRAMGHGDMLVLVDTNFPAASVARHTVVGRALSMENVGLAVALTAVLSVLPLDTFTADFAAMMQVVGDAGAEAEAHRVIRAAMVRSEEMRPVPSVERFAFYGLAREAFAIVATGERLPYGNVMLRKGIVGPDGRAG